MACPQLPHYFTTCILFLKFVNKGVFLRKSSIFLEKRVFWYSPQWIGRKRGYLLCPVFYREKGGSFGLTSQYFTTEKGVHVGLKCQCLIAKRGLFELKGQCFAAKRGLFSKWRTRMGTIFSSEWGSQGHAQTLNTNHCLLCFSCNHGVTIVFYVNPRLLRDDQTFLAAKPYKVYHKGGRTVVEFSTPTKTWKVSFLTHHGSRCFFLLGVGQLGLYTWFNPPKPGLQSRDLCGTMCTLSIANSTLLNWPIVNLLIWFILYYLVVFFCILVHDYNLCFTGFCYNVGHYNYNSIWPYYIDVH